MKFILGRDYDEYLKLPEASNESKQDKDKDKEQASSAVIAVNLVKEFCEEFFIDNLGQPYAAIKVDEHLEVLPIKSEKFKNWLTKLYFDISVEEVKKQQQKSDAKSQTLTAFGDILSSEALLRALRVLKAEAEFSGKPRKELYLRVAKEGDTIYYDLTDSKWQAVKITPEGWSIIYSPILFKRYAPQIPQVIPEQNSTSDIFDNFLSLLNISGSEDNKLLFKCYIVSLFYHGIVHAALMLHGEGGSAKTSLQEFIKMLVDPSAVLTLSLSYDIESMVQKIAQNYVCFFDNISKIPDIISDLLCRAITGSGFMKRELFTNDEIIIYQLRYCIGLTGVNLAATKSDLIDRGLIIEHKAIKSKKRMLVILAKFNEIRPKLLGYIFDVLVKVLKFEKQLPEGLQLENYPRLADFAEIGEIISRCMGNKDMMFIEAFQRNIETRHRRIVNDSVVGRAIEIFMERPHENNEWTGTMDILLSDLREIARTNLKLESVKNSKYWPQTPNVLSRKINEIKSNLREIGIEIDRASSDTSERTYTIKNTKKKEREKEERKKDQEGKEDEKKGEKKSDDLPCTRSSTKISLVSLESLGSTKPDDANNNNVTDKASDTSTTSDNFDKPTMQASIFDKKISQKKVEQVLGLYVAFDLEWNENKDNTIEVVSFVDSNGNSEVKFRERDFGGSEIALLRYIMAKLLDYQWSLGWNTQGNTSNAGGTKIFDLYILHERCKANGINSIVKLGNKGLPYLIGDELKHIDLLNIYSKAMVKDGMYHSAYRTNKLDDVSKTLLGYGKYKNYSGADFKNLSIEEQIEYSLRDSQLVMEISKYNDFEVLDAMLAVAEITELDFEKVCRTNLSTWWGAIFDKLMRDCKCPPLTKLEFTASYKGAEVLAPKKGLYNNIVVVDAKSLYPSVGINYNLSFDTINCDCCQNNPDAALSKIIPDKFTKDCKFVKPSTEWICRRRVGAFPSKLKIFKAERLKQKDLGNKAKQHALKILINGGYGVFGNKDYSFYDPRVAELVTAAGRYILSEMQHSANYDYGFEIIYRDTDSLFLHNVTDKSLKQFQEKFSEKYDIELEIKNKYDKLLLSANKKHYIGYEKGTIETVGFEGEKSDRPEFFHKVYNQLIEDIIKQEIDPLPNLRKTISDLDSKASPDSLKISKLLNKELDEYEPTTQIYKIGKALGAKKGDIIEYYSANKTKTGNSWTLDPTEIDIPHYKELLWNTIDEILEIAGYPMVELAQEFGIKAKKKRIKNCDIVRNKPNDIGGE